MNTLMNLENLEDLTKKELINRCWESNILRFNAKGLLLFKGYKNKRKNQIIEMIKEYEYKRKEIIERAIWVEEYNDSLPQHKFFDAKRQKEMSEAIDGIYDIEYTEYVYYNNDLYGRIKNIRE